MLLFMIRLEFMTIHDCGKYIESGFPNLSQRTYRKPSYIHISETCTLHEVTMTSYLVHFEITHVFLPIVFTNSYCDLIGQSMWYIFHIPLVNSHCEFALRALSSISQS